MIEDNHDGVRVQCDNTSGNGWFLLRLSLHEPILPLNFESGSAGGIQQIISRLRPFLENFEYLNLESLA